MSTLPLVTILINTYRRFEEIQITIDSLLDNLIYPRDRLKWLISDDHSGGDYPYNLADIERYHDLNLKFAVLPKNSGYGASLNNGLSYIDTPHVYLTEDDWRLCHKLDLRMGVGILETQPHIGVLRYGGTAGDMPYTYHQHEAAIGEYARENIYAADYVEGKVTYLEIDVNSPSLYVWSGRPQLAKLRWFYDIGLLPEGLRPGETEIAMCHKVKDYLRQASFAQQIAILPDFVNMQYQHVGAISYQLKEIGSDEQVSV